ncbi:MAG: hypothetical protein KGL39_42060 [Patescibacteria group bacterium]|nr:hypothetical protein [Patescibacteria group bacterium]
MKAKPELQTHLVEKCYWNCGHPSHRHRSERIAARCMEKSANKKPANIAKKPQWIQATRAVLNGQTLKEVGESFGISDTRCSAWVHKTIMMATHQSRCQEEIPEPTNRHFFSDVSELRKHADFWLPHVEALAKEWGIN